MSTLNCPHCHKEIELSDVLSSQVDHQVHARVEEELKRSRAQMIEEIEIKTKKDLLAIQEAEIEKRKKLWAEDYEFEKRKAESEKEQLAKQNEKIKNDLNLLREKELELQKKALEQQSILNDIEIQNKQAIEREKLKVEQDLKTKHKEEFEKLMEDNKIASELKAKQDQITIDNMKKKIEELSRSAKTDGSQRTQGEALELVGEDYLKERFPDDLVVPVKTGANGSDVVHTVKTSRNKEAGKIKWEFKRTKTWTDGYIKKLAEDMEKYNAPIGVIVTETLPKEAIEGGGFAQFENIYVMSMSRFKIFAPIIRDIILKIHRNEAIAHASKEMKDHLFDYLISLEFTNSLKNLFDFINAMEFDYNQEHRRMSTILKRRQKLIEKATNSFTTLYSGLQSVSNQSIVRIDDLENDYLIEDLSSEDSELEEEYLD